MDCMRLTLADVGDSIEDENFEEEIAEAQFLRFYAFVEWVKQIFNVNSIDIKEKLIQIILVV